MNDEHEEAFVGLQAPVMHGEHVASVRVSVRDLRALVEERDLLLQQVTALQTHQTAQLLLARSMTFETAARLCEANAIAMQLASQQAPDDGDDSLIAIAAGVAAAECAQAIRNLSKKS